MCFKCGNIEHFDNSFFEKAIQDKLSKKQAQPRYKVSIGYEEHFKNNYNKGLNETIKLTLKNLIK